MNGAYVEGDNFTIAGRLDNPTATIMAWVTDSQGRTVVREALVGRDGDFYFYNVPQPEGASYISLIAFDAATNSSTTNFTIHRSHAGLKLDPLSIMAGLPAVTVTGSIGRTNYAVWVNGVQAVVQTNGKWKADGVPTTYRGVDIITASERPIGTNAPDPDAETNAPPPMYWGNATNQIKAGVYFPAPPTNHVNRYACDLYVMNTSGSNQSLSWVRPKEHARFVPYLYDRNGTIVPMTMMDEPLELLPNARMNIHHLGKQDVDLIDGFLDLPANTLTRVASLNLADWFSLSPGQYI